MINRLLPIWLVLTAVAAALFFDTLVAAIVVIIVALVVAVGYALLHWKQKLFLVPALTEIAVGFSLWLGLIAIFGLRSLQVAPLWVVVPLGILVIAAATIFWAGSWRPTLPSLTLAILSAEFFIFLLFAPASFLILAALVAVWFVAGGLIIRAPEKFLPPLITLILFVLLTILFFNWTL